MQYAGRILRPCDGKATAEVHDYHGELTGVLASSLAKRARLHQPRLPRPPQAPLDPQRQHGTPSPARRTSAVKRRAARRVCLGDPVLGGG
jgi:superfamily II DNA or RNA helicase